MSHNVGGIYVRAKAGRTVITQQAIADAVAGYFTDHGAKRDDAGVLALKPLTVDAKRRRLGVAVMPEQAGWIVIADSERYTADHGLAAHLSKRLGVEVLWYVLYGATGAGIARRFGRKRKAPPETYDDVEQLVGELPRAFTYFDQLTPRALKGAVVMGFSGVKQYDTGPEPGEDEDEEGDEPEVDDDAAPAKRASRTGPVLDLAARAPFKPIRLRKGKLTVGRDTLTLGFSCRAPFAKVARGVEQVMDLYAAAIPLGALRWGLMGESSTTVRKLASLDRARAMLKQKGKLKGETVMFFLAGDDEWPSEPPCKTEPEAPSFLFSCSLEVKLVDEEMDWGWHRPTSTIEMRFPSDYLWQLGADRFVELATRMAALLPVQSGQAAIALGWNPLLSSTSQEAPPLAAPHLLAHPGLDVGGDIFSLGDRSRGANWLTFVGADLAAKLGGPKKLRASLHRGVRVTEAGTTLVVRAGEAPLPDPTKVEFAYLRSVAQALAPVTRFETDPSVFDGRDTLAKRYAYRFLGGTPPRT